MTVEQYLHTSFEVEPDYIDGKLVRRHVGSLPHACAKGRMLELLSGLQGFSWDAYLSLTLIMSPTRCRVADVVAFANKIEKDYPDEPGELAIEILEREDRFGEMMQRLSDYRVWGIKHVWLVDPWNYNLYIYDSTGLHEVSSFELPEFGARILPAQIFDQTPQQ